MLQLHTKKFDICRISKLLAKYNVKASISNQFITLNGEISNELLDELCNLITIYNVQNFDDVALEQKVIKKYDLLYPTVKRGEVYFCDFGEPYSCEQGYKRPAIVVQNDAGNLNAPTTIVLPCTTGHKKCLPIHYYFTFSNENMIDYDAVRVKLERNIVMAEQIRTVDKSRLRKFIGTMTPEFIDKMQEIIDISLGLQRQEKVITKTETVYVDKDEEEDHDEKDNL